MGHVELLSPAGDMEKLEFALAYGADAVYCGLEDWNLRKSAGNLSREGMERAVSLTHRKGKKIYVALNIFPRDRDIPDMLDAAIFLGSIRIDGVIVADPGLIRLIRIAVPDLPIHVSTQANVLNSAAAQLYASLGASRIILARELSLEEIRRIRNALPAEVELEGFVHGAMCMAYSGRCLISGYLAGRDGNRGDCSQSCRWRYVLMEEKRPGETFPVTEDAQGTYFFHSRDLCMIDHIPDLIQAGLSGLKIEGRMKSLFYVAAATLAYRKAIQAYSENPGTWKPREEWKKLASMSSHREFCTGFYYPHAGDQIFREGGTVKNYAFAGVVTGYDPETGTAEILQKSPVSEGDPLEIITPDGHIFFQDAEGLSTPDGTILRNTPHPHMRYRMKVRKPVDLRSIVIRKEGKMI